MHSPDFMAKIKDCTPIAGDAAYSNPSNANCGPYDLVFENETVIFIKHERNCATHKDFS